MANIKANIKNIRKTKKRNLRNKQSVSSMKTLIKKSRTNNNDKDISAVYKKTDAVCAKKKIHKNKANRLKSRAAKALNKSKNQAKKEPQTKSVAKNENK